MGAAALRVVKSNPPDAPFPTENVPVRGTVFTFAPDALAGLMNAVYVFALVSVSLSVSDVPAVVELPLAVMLAPPVGGVTTRVPWKSALSVVVAPPEIVRPFACVPFPIVLVEYAVRPPLNCVRVEVALPGSGNGYALPVGHVLRQGRSEVKHSTAVEMAVVEA